MCGREVTTAFATYRESLAWTGAACGEGGGKREEEALATLRWGNRRRFTRRSASPSERSERFPIPYGVVSSSVTVGASVT